MRKDVFDELVVVKRSGQRVNFNTYKIAVAIKNAFDKFENKYDEKNINEIYENVLKYIVINYVSRKTINVEDIQDIIEEELKNKKYLDVYEEFSTYRKQRAASRKAFGIKQQHKFAKAMETLADIDLIGNENSFKSEEIINYYGKTILDEYVKSYIIDNKYLRMHDEGNIYIESLTNASIGKIEETNILLDNAINDLSNVDELLNYLLDLTKEISGEIHISNIEKLLSKCALNRLKEKTKEYIDRYSIASGFDNYLNKKVIDNIIDNKIDLDFLPDIKKLALNKRVEELFTLSYNDSFNKVNILITKDLIYLINKLNNSNKKFSFSFSKGSSNIENNISKLILYILDNNERYDNVSFIYKFNKEDDNLNTIYNIVKENKNILLHNNININKEFMSNGINIYENFNDDFYSNGRAVISKTSINMARLGIICKEEPKEYLFNKIDEVLDLVKNELLLMFESVGNKNKDNYDLLFDNNILYDEKLESGGKIRKVIKNSCLLIGLVGLSECVNILEKDGNKRYILLTEILSYIKNKCKTYREDTKLNFYIYEPSDQKGSNYLIRIDKSIYGKEKELSNKNNYSLLTNINALNNDFSKLKELSNLLDAGMLITKNIKSNISYKKFIYILDEMIKEEIELISFNRSDL